MALGQARWYAGMEPESAFSRVLDVADTLGATSERTLACGAMDGAPRPR
jgi:hypothetical protein